MTKLTPERIAAIRVNLDFCNAVGALISRDELRALLDIAEKHTEVLRYLSQHFRQYFVGPQNQGSVQQY